ncbi:MAG: alanine--tRNA ligase [Alphaproteobacteria bacterium]
MKTANDIRRTFLEYFARHGHEVVPSSPLVPRNDPTLMFANSGMVQFKNVFTGAEQRPYKRATTAQKCVRAGGKHNDLENVGYTARHHTFFEMLGNFSFGDYFKDVAIELAWNLIVKEYGLSKDRLWVTVYSEDDEAHALWKKIAGLPDSRIVRIPTSDNFWAMGDTGPCGPCSELFFDHGDKVPGGPPGSADADGDRFIEIWNLVFMQYEQVTKDKRVDLPRPSIDTGMGLERVTAVLQGKHDNYDIDLMRALIEASAAASGASAEGPHAVSHRVIADHLRASVFLIADGVLPSNEGRGYVLRRIMRRAMRHAHLLGCREPLMWRLVPNLVREMGGQYPELGRAEALVAQTLKLEESRFKDMLGRGLKLLEDETGKLKTGQALAGEIAFRLYDTFGFPLDLTQDILRGQGRAVDSQGFEGAMERQREAARRAWSGSGEQATEQVWFQVREKTGATEFLGYDTEIAEGRILAILVDGRMVEEAPIGREADVVLNQTPFYAESGGQMGDTGVLFTSSGAEFAVTDTLKKLGDLHVHRGKSAHKALRVGDSAELRVERARRSALRANHSATHLLHAALRRILGGHVTQKGSLVAPDRLRFDFSHHKPISPEELARVEADVNRQIRANGEVTTRLMTPDEAIAEGAMALFGEKYDDEVRVLAMGEEGGTPFSVELCGGTHVARTGDIGVFKISSEGAVASGVRRIEAVSGTEAFQYLSANTALVASIAAAIGMSASIAGKMSDVVSASATVGGSGTASGDIACDAAVGIGTPNLLLRIQAILDEKRQLERELSNLRRKLASGGGGASPTTRDIDGITYIARRAEDVPARELKGLADELKRQAGSGIVAVIAVEEGRASLVVGVTDDLAKRFNAVELVRAGSEILGGKGGGGRPDMAQGGGPDAGRTDAALDAIGEAVRRMASAS